MCMYSMCIHICMHVSMYVCILFDLYYVISLFLSLSFSVLSPKICSTKSVSSMFRLRRWKPWFMPQRRNNWCELLPLPSRELNPRLWDWKSDAVPTERSGFWFYPDDCLGHLSWEMLEVATSFQIAADILMWAGWTVKLRKTGATEPKKCCFAPAPWQEYLGLLVSNWLCPSWPVFLISACD